MSEDPLGTAPSLTLGELARLTVEQRFDLLLPLCRQDVRAALDELQALFRRDWPLVSVERIVRSLALNVGLTAEEILAIPTLTGRRQPRTTLSGLLGDDAPWSEFWAWFAEDAGRGKDGRLSHLAEFALFTACEQREDWLRPEDRPRAKETAEAAQAIVYEGYTKGLRLALRSTFKGEIDDFEDPTHDAFVRVIRDYWKDDARHRFLGTGGGLAFLASIGRNAVYDQIRRRGGKSPRPLFEDDENGNPIERPELGAEDTHFPRLIAADQLEGARDCLRRTQSDKEFKERNVLICEAVWFHRERPGDVARDWGIAAPRVTQITRDALKRMAACLKALGIDFNLRPKKRQAKP